MERIATADDLSVFVESQLGDVSARIDAYVTSAMGEMPSAGGDYRNLWHSIGKQFEGGKNVRPSLVLAAYAGLGGEDPAAAIPVAAAMEMLHISMLVHDDILDHDEIRRGRPNVAGIRRADLAGSDLDDDQLEDQVLAAALLAGDLCISAAYDLIAGANLPAHHRIACLSLLSRAIRTTIAGELLDTYGDSVPVHEANSLLVAELKTATYSFIVPLLAGAQLAGGDPTMISHLEKLGASLGLSFQLADDDLGVFGDPERTGKSRLSDLRAGKRTELLRFTYHLATPAQRKRLDALVGDRLLDDDGAAEIRDIMEASGGRREAARLAAQHARQARRIAQERIPAPLSGYLSALIDTLEDRSN